MDKLVLEVIIAITVGIFTNIVSGFIQPAADRNKRWAVSGFIVVALLSVLIAIPPIQQEESEISLRDNTLAEPVDNGTPNKSPNPLKSESEGKRELDREPPYSTPSRRERFNEENNAPSRLSEVEPINQNQPKHNEESQSTTNEEVQSTLSEEDCLKVKISDRAEDCVNGLLAKPTDINTLYYSKQELDCVLDARYRLVESIREIRAGNSHIRSEREMLIVDGIDQAGWALRKLKSGMDEVSRCPPEYRNIYTELMDTMGNASTVQGMAEGIFKLRSDWRARKVDELVKQQRESFEKFGDIIDSLHNPYFHCKVGIYKEWYEKTVDRNSFISIDEHFSESKLTIGQAPQSISDYCERKVL